MSSVLEISLEAIISKLSLSVKSNSCNKSPLTVGISGVQGSGKSTLVKNLYQILTKPPHKLSVSYFSLDDFYSTRDELIALKSSFPKNRLFEYRGSSGTHDLALCKMVLDKIYSNKETVNIPVYDKTAFQGTGDRFPESKWNKVTLPVDLLLVEGWMLGFQPHTSLGLKNILSQAPSEDKALLGKLGSDYLSPTFRDHSEIDIINLNENLKNYQFIWDKLDLLIQLLPKEISYVYDWRWEQECCQPKPGLTKSQVKNFVDRFMPSYELYLPFLNLPNRPHIVLSLDSERNVQSQKQMSIAHGI